MLQCIEFHGAYFFGTPAITVARRFWLNPTALASIRASCVSASTLSSSFPLPQHQNRYPIGHQSSMPWRLVKPPQENSENCREVQKHKPTQFQVLRIYIHSRSTSELDDCEHCYTVSSVHKKTHGGELNAEIITNAKTTL